jgi:hypothetical protein
MLVDLDEVTVTVVEVNTSGDIIEQIKLHLTNDHDNTQQGTI